MRLLQNPDGHRLSGPGFTLVEILVVVVIIAIAAAMVVPCLGTHCDVEAMSATQAMVADLEYAQNQAIATQSNVTVAFNTGAESYLLRDANNVTLQQPISKNNYQVTYPTTSGYQDVNLMTANFNGQPTLTFDHLGSPAQGGQVTLGAGGYSYQVSVAAVTGKITVAQLTP